MTPTRARERAHALLTKLAPWPIKSEDVCDPVQHCGWCDAITDALMEVEREAEELCWRMVEVVITDRCREPFNGYDAVNAVPSLLVYIAEQRARAADEGGRDGT